MSQRPTYFQFYQRIWQIQFWDFYEYLSFKILAFVVFCEEFDTNKTAKYLFHREFGIRIVYWKHQKQVLKSIPLKCFSRKLANLSKTLRRSSCFSKIASWKSRTFIILNSDKDIFPRIFLKFWVASDKFLKF